MSDKTGLYIPFAKIEESDDGTITIEGIASSECVDAHGETITADAMKNALPDFFKYGTGNLREMHQPLAAGTIEKAEIGEDGRTYITAKVVDPVAVKKVQMGVYKAFSIGGSKLKDGYDKLTKTITALKLTEISLVDRPANPEAVITMWKAEDMNGNQTENEPILNADEAEMVRGQSDIAKALASPELQSMIAQAIAEGIAKGLQTAQEVKEVAPIVAEEKPVSELKKAFGALKVNADDVTKSADVIEKGMYQVADFANVINSLAWLQRSCQYEAESEGDNSPLPAKLADLIGQAGQCLMDMAQEELSELMAEMKGEQAESAITVLNNVVANSVYAEDLKKSNELIDIIKAGARNSAKDKADIQKAHDLLMGLGAACAEPEVITEKHDHSHDISKADFEKVAGELGVLRKSLETITEENSILKSNYDELKKSYDALPQMPKAILKVVGKGDELSDLAGDEPKVEPVLKQDGTIDEAATAIKAIHSGGGRSLYQR